MHESVQLSDRCGYERFYMCTYVCMSMPKNDENAYECTYVYTNVSVYIFICLFLLL